MGVLKVVKTKSYYKRYQVKLRRRRECKTDYQARRTLIVQDKNKYNSPKYRLVVRITNKDVICQLVAAKVIGDEILASAYAHELPRYGVKAGFTNYAACYCTGLLAARRALKKVGLDAIYEGCTAPDGELFENEVNDEMDEDEIKRPLRAYLDVGLARTTTGARLFGVLKGAVDGGLDVPHREKRFPGFFKAQDKDKGEDRFEADIHRKYIFGGHVAEYMKKMQEESEDKYKAHFAKYIAGGINADNMEKMYTEAHAAIRADPSPSDKKKKDLKTIKTFPHRRKMHRNQRKARVQQKIANAVAKAAAE